MLRRLFTVASALSLLLCIAVLVDQTFRHPPTSPAPMPSPARTVNTQSGEIETIDYHGAVVGPLRSYAIFGFRVPFGTATLITVVLPICWGLLRLIGPFKDPPAA